MLLYCVLSLRSVCRVLYIVCCRRVLCVVVVLCCVYRQGPVRAELHSKVRPQNGTERSHGGQPTLTGPADVLQRLSGRNPPRGNLVCHAGVD